jgi:hypothetical protein
MSTRERWHDDASGNDTQRLFAGGLVLLAAIVMIAIGAPAPPTPHWEFSVDAAERWPPAVRPIERARAEALSALFRARARGSVEGVVGACETFAALGDREVVTACVRVARGLAGGARVEDRLRALER